MRNDSGRDRASHIAIALPDVRGSVTFWVICTCVGMYLAQTMLNLLGICDVHVRQPLFPIKEELYSKFEKKLKVDSLL